MTRTNAAETHERPIGDRMRVAVTVCSSMILATMMCAPCTGARGAAKGSREASFAPLIAGDLESARGDLLEALGDRPDGVPTLPAGIDPSLSEYTHHLISTGMSVAPNKLASYAASLEPSLAPIDAPMVRVMPERAVPMLVGHIHTLETLETLRPLTGDESAKLLDHYEILWSFIGLYPVVQQVHDVEIELKLEVDPAVHTRATWAEEYREGVWAPLRYRLLDELENGGEKDLERRAQRLASSARTRWRSGAAGGGRLYVAAMRYLAAVAPKHENVANVVLVAVHVDGLAALPRKKRVPVEVRQDETYLRVDEVVAAWRELESLKGASDVEKRLRTARLLFRRDRETEQRKVLYQVLKDEPGHAEATTRLAISFAESAPRLAHDIVVRADLSAAELEDDTLALRFPIQWVHALMTGMAGGGESGDAAIRGLDAELTAIETLIGACGDRVPASTAYSSLLADSLRQLWIDGRPIDDVDLGTHIPALIEVVQSGPDEDLYRLLMFATRMSPGFREYELLEIPLDEGYEPQTQCALHADRARSVLAAAARGLEDERQLDGIAAEVAAVADSCGEGGMVNKLRGDLVVLRTLHASDPPSLDEAIPYYEGCAASLDRVRASTCRGNLFVLHHEAGREADAREAMERLWRCCIDHPPTVYLAALAVGEGRLPDPDLWLEQVVSSEELLNEPERAWMCAGDIAARAGDTERAATHWQEACATLAAQCDDGREPLECLPGLFIGNGSMTLGLSGNPTAPITVQYDQQLRLLSNCEEAFVQWVRDGGCEADPTSSTARSSSASATDSTADDRPVPGP